MLVIREEVSDNGIRYGSDDVKNTHKNAVSKERVVGGGLVVLGLGVVDLGNALGVRRLILASRLYFGAIKDISGICSKFYLKW